MDNKRNVSFGRSIGYFFIVLLIVFGTKLYGRFDVQFFVSFVIAFFGMVILGEGYPRRLLFLLGWLAFFAIYSGIISLLHGGQEYIYFLKFSRTLLMFIILYFVYQFLRRSYTYNDFSRLLVLVVFAHSVIVILCIVSPEVRAVVYSLTGYVPRGPEWSRSPGLTISFNATAIVHVVALWFLVDRNYWPLGRKLLLGITIVASLLFLGRAMSYLGILFILLLLLTRKRNWFKYTWAVGVVVFTILTLQVFSEGYTSETETESVSGKILANLQHFSAPLANVGTGEGGVDMYYSSNMSSHIYFSDNAYVLLFGNSQAGHIGVVGGVGETDSDMGIINSINANGLFVTLMIYLFYCCLIYLSRRGDWRTVLLISSLSMSLSFKETGLFTSHATQLLFLVFFYQYFSSNYSIKKYGQ